MIFIWTSAIASPIKGIFCVGTKDRRDSFVFTAGMAMHKPWGKVFKGESYPLCCRVPFVQCCSPSHLTPWNKDYPLIRTKYLDHGRLGGLSGEVRWSGGGGHYASPNNWLPNEQDSSLCRFEWDFLFMSSLHGADNILCSPRCRLRKRAEEQQEEWKWNGGRRQTSSQWHSFLRTRFGPNIPLADMREMENFFGDLWGLFEDSWGPCGLQTASKARSDLIFEI